MAETNSTTTTNANSARNPLIDVLITIILPSLILMKLSGDHRLGTVAALLLALSLPLLWGSWDLWARRKFNGFALLGLISVALTGGIGLLQLDAHWLAVKEAAIPGLIGLAVLVSSWTRYPLIRVILYNPAVLNVERVQQQLDARGNTQAFERRLKVATLLVAGTFFFSSTMNFILARWIVTSPAGSVAFNEELGRLTLLSYPVIAIPSMVMMIVTLLWLGRGIRQLSGLSLLDLINDSRAAKASGR